MTEFRGYAPPPDAGMADRLRESATWMDNAGRARPITGMDEEHLLNVLGYLVRHGRALWTDAHAGKALPADRAIVDWLAARPLWTGIVAELRRRGAIGPREDVFGVLRVRAAIYRSAAASAYSDELDEQERLFLAR